MGILQLLTGLADWANQYVGAKGELTADESNWDLRLGDGATPGGHIIQTRANADARYQFKNPELANWNFAEVEKGLLVRTAPGAYSIRPLEGIGDIAITNPAGTAGNPQISLKPTLAGAYTFTLKQTFSGGLEGDLEGDTFGTHTGPSTGLHTGNVIGNVQGNTEGNHVGGVDARGAQLFFDEGQIPGSAVDLDIPAAIPVGGIIIWSGAANAIPAGWLLCDGTNGTPDLRNRFVVGAADVYPVGGTGGAAVHTHVLDIEEGGVHAHAVTVNNHALTLDQIPAHKHANGVVDNNGNLFNHGAVGANPQGTHSIEGQGNVGVYEGWTTTVGGLAGVTQGHNHGATSAMDGLHTHSAEAADANHLPPYYALCYIMKGA